MPTSPSTAADPGFSIHLDVLGADEVDRLLIDLETHGVKRSRAGARHLLSNPSVAAWAREERLMAIARGILGPAAFPFRATLFDKSPSANWLVVWHQDTALPVRERKEQPGWGPWSVKAGVLYAHAPAEALANVVALRLHLDDSARDNGPLCVLPGSHRSGVFTDLELVELSRRVDPHPCVAPRGSLLTMRPLLVHASSKARSASRRRVLHVEYGTTSDLGGGLELGTA